MAAVPLNINILKKQLNGRSIVIELNKIAHYYYEVPSILNHKQSRSLSINSYWLYICLQNFSDLKVTNINHVKIKIISFLI